MTAVLVPAATFWGKVDKNGPIPAHVPELGTCWLWTASTDGKGYGNIRIRQKLYRAHRIAYELLVGPIPDGLLLRHRCDTPPCVNPAHLIPGTQLSNIHDAIRRGRKVQVRGERVGTAKLTERQVCEIRKLATAGVLSGRAIGRLYGVSHTVVQGIICGAGWTHVGGAS